MNEVGTNAAMSRRRRGERAAWTTKRLLRPERCRRVSWRSGCASLSATRSFGGRRRAFSGRAELSCWVVCRHRIGPAGEAARAAADVHLRAAVAPRFPQVAHPRAKQVLKVGRKDPWTKPPFSTSWRKIFLTMRKFFSQEVEDGVPAAGARGRVALCGPRRVHAPDRPALHRANGDHGWARLASRQTDGGVLTPRSRGLRRRRFAGVHPALSLPGDGGNLDQLRHRSARGARLRDLRARRPSPGAGRLVGQTRPYGDRRRGRPLRRARSRPRLLRLCRRCHDRRWRLKPRLFVRG